MDPCSSPSPGTNEEKHFFVETISLMEKLGKCVPDIIVARNSTHSPLRTNIWGIEYVHWNE